MRLILVCMSATKSISVQPADWKELETDWRRLERLCSVATPFQTWAWIHGFWSVGMLEGEPMLLAVARGSKVVGIAPFVRLAAHRGLRRLRLMGGDYADILIEPGSEAEVCEALAEYLARVQKGVWDIIDLRGLVEGAAALHLAGVEALQGSVVEHQKYPVACLPNSWDEYKTGLSKGLRDQLRYYPNRISRHFPGSRIDESSAETLDRDLSLFFQLHQSRWKEKGMHGLLSTEQTQEFHREVAHEFFASDMLRLYTYWFGDTAAASLCCFQKGNRVCYYLGGFDPAFASYSASKMLIGHAVRRAIEEGAQYFDFLKGEEPYKLEWGAEPTATYRVLLTAGGLKPRLAVAGLRMQPKVKALKNKFKRG